MIYNFTFNIVIKSIFFFIVVYRRFLQFLVAFVLRIRNSFVPGQPCADTFYIWNHNIRYGDRNMLFWTYGKSVFHTEVHTSLVLFIFRHGFRYSYQIDFKLLFLESSSFYACMILEYTFFLLS